MAGTSQCKVLPKDWALGLVVAVLYFGISLLCAQLPEISSSSEAREAHVSRTIVQSGEWIYPTRNGVVPSKPPLMHWIAALVGSVTGGDVSVSVQRGVSAFFGAGALFLTYLLGLSFATGSQQLRDGAASVGLASTFILSLIYGFSRLSIDARVDMGFTFFMLLAISAVLIPVFRCEDLSALHKRSSMRYLFGAACGCAVITKGPLGLLLPSLVVFFMLTFRYGLRATLRFGLAPTGAWLLFVMVALPWYLWGAYHGGDPFLTRYFFENISRVTGGAFIPSKPFWYYLGTVVRTTFPWWIFLIVVLYQLAVRMREMPHDTRWKYFRSERLNLLLVWFGAGFLFFSLCSGKRHTYLLPLYPALAVYLATSGVAWWRTLQSGAQYWWRKVGLYAQEVFLFTVVFIALFLSVAEMAQYLQPYQMRAVGAWLADTQDTVLPVMIIAVFLVAISRVIHEIQSKAVVLWSGTVLCFMLALNVGFGMKAELKGFAPFAAAIRHEVPPSEPLMVVKHWHDELFDPVMYYLDRSVELGDPNLVVLPRHGYVLLRATQLDTFVAQRKLFYGSFAEVLKHRQLSDRIRERSDRDLVLLFIDRAGSVGGVV